MGTYTPNLNLYKPDASDDFGSFRAEFNDNMDKLDNGGGGGGGHTIVDENGSDMPAEGKLQFTGNVSVTDDNVNGATVVDVLGGGGNVYGAFLDPSRVIYSAFTFDSSTHSWTATEDCILTDNMTPPDSSTAYFIRIDGKQVFAGYSTVEDPFVYVKKGQVVEYRAKSGSTMKAYGILQGTNGIFAPVIYSDNERVIGVWRDNKPLYQKTIQTGNLPNNSSMYISTPSNIENLVHYSGFMYSTNTPSSQRPLPFSAGGVNDVRVDLDGGVIRITDYANWSTYNAYLTVQYTKTTDVAGSGNWNTDGVPTHHYSTSEQVIGTWIDGKPLYECVLELTQDTNLTADTWVKTEFNQTTMKALIKAVAVIGSNGAVIEALSGGFIDGKIALNSARNVGLNVADSARLIVQYTKSTD